MPRTVDQSQRITLAEATERFARRGDAIALQSPDRGAVGYAELADRVEWLVAALVDLGLAPGERLALLLSNGSRIIECYLACARSGIVAVPLSERATFGELLHQLGDSAPAALVYSEDAAELIEAVRAESACPSLLIATGSDPGGLSYEDLLRSSPTPAELPTPLAESLFCLMYTGGTTGVPKAAEQTQLSWAASIRGVAREWKLDESDRHLAVLPMDHVSWFSTMSMLLVGGTTFIEGGWNPERALEVVAREGITTMNMIPTMFGDFLEAIAGRPELSTRTLRLLTVAGSPMPVEMYRRGIELIGPIIGSVYGMTETSGPVSFLLPTDLSADRLRSGGRPGPAVELAILGADGGQTDGREPGEIGLRGPQVTSGYLNQPEATAAAFRNGWFLTGDVGRTDDRGLVHIVDRSKDMVKSGGFNVYPKEVEEVLYTHPDVLEAAVVGVPDERWIEAVHAGVVLRGESALDAEGLRAYCRARLPGYKAPKVVHLEARLPRTKVGKFDKRALRERYSD